VYWVRRFWRFGVCAALVLSLAGVFAPASSLAASSAAATVRLRLTGLNRDGQVVGIPAAAMLSIPAGSQYYYQGAPLSVPRGTYLIAAEVPAYSGTKLTSQTLVFRKVTIERAETLRLDGRGGQRLTVALSGAQASGSDLIATACLSQYPHQSAVLAGSATGGPGVAVYAVPVKSPYITFGYFRILTSPAGATYYLIGSRRGQIPAHLGYRQRASGLAKLTMTLRSGVYGSSNFDWQIQSGNDQTLCGAGQNMNTLGPRSWVTYVTPGTWSTSVEADSDHAGRFYPTASEYATTRLRAGRSYANVFGAAVAGPGPDFPQTSANYNDDASPYALLSYTPDLYAGPALMGGSVCCDQGTVILRRGSRLVRKHAVGTGGLFTAPIRQSGWYTLTDTDHRWFRGNSTPAGLLSPRVSVSFRFYASSHPAGDGDFQNSPLTRARYQPLGLNSANQAPAGGSTKLDVAIARPMNAGIATPAFRLKTIAVYASVNGGARWVRLKLRRVGGHWQVVVRDPSAGYVSIRSVVTDAHGDRTEQTVYRAYAVS
jgi:hypothetical protein